MGKSARSLRASSFACAVTATLPSYPALRGEKRTVACFADAFVSVTRHERGMRKDSPFTSHGRAFLAGLRIRIAEGSYGAEWFSASDEPEHEAAERLGAVLDPPRPSARVHDERLRDLRPARRRCEDVALRRRHPWLRRDPAEQRLLVGAVVERPPIPSG
jgi:hypothetical protein